MNFFASNIVYKRLNIFSNRGIHLKNKEAFLENLKVNGAEIPADFIPEIYRSLNPDVDAHCKTEWDAYAHYSRHGALEKRVYQNTDWSFYSALYLSGQRLSREQYVAHFLNVGYKNGYALSEASLFNSYRLSPEPFWINDFSTREFLLLNSDWAPPALNREQALACFLAEGVQRLAPISFRKRFDPEIYRELNPDFANEDDAQLYWRWLRSNMSDASACSESDWLDSRSVPLDHFPLGFAWRHYAGSRTDLNGNILAGRWHALGHLLDHLEKEAKTVPVTNQYPADFLNALGLKLFQGEQTVIAAETFERARSFEGHPDILRNLADCYFLMEQWQAAIDTYALALAGGASQNTSSVVNIAVSWARLLNFSEAFRHLAEAKSDFKGNQEWRACLDRTIELYFIHVSAQAQAIYSDGLRVEADALLLTAVDVVTASWEQCMSLPVPSRERGTSRVVMLAVTSLKQCKHYRVDQKKEFLALHGVDVEIFDFNEVEAFLCALPDADVVIFYRLPAFPQIVRAILSARSQNIPTYYDIDDLIFEPQLYPDSFESFQGAISRRVYQDLMFGTPLHAAAMRLCDFGLASTPALAEHVSRFVRTGKTFVIRNALDERILSDLPRAQLDGPRSSAIHIFYGSATLSHNQDFNDIACHALLPLMLANEQVKLVVAGHLDLDQRFDAVRSQVIRLGMIDDLSTYWSIVGGCDINLATLTDTPMNNSKSEIKWLEAAALGIPSVVSATQTYREVIEEGVTGFTASTLDDWAVALKRLVGDADMRRRVGTAARSRVREAYSPQIVADTLSKALFEPSQAVAPINVPPRRKKRALIVNVFFPPQSIGGATRIVADNVRSWIDGEGQKDWDFAIATTDYQNLVPYSERTESWSGIPVFKVAPPFTHNLDWQATDPKMKAWFRRILKRFAPDVVHFHCVQRLTGSVIEACLDEDIPYLITAHDGWWLSDYQFMFDEACRVRLPGDEQRLGLRAGISAGQNIERKLKLDPLLRGAAALLTPSRRFMEIYRNAGFTSAVTIPNGVPEIAVKPRLPSRSGRVRIGHIGDTSPHKGFDLIEAALRQSRFENIELVGVSHGQREGHEIRDVWGASPVLLRGKVPQQRVGELYADLDVLAAPSACVESYGLVTREANAAGLWVIASDRGAIGEDVRPGIDGFVVDVSTPEGLINVFRMMNEHPDRFLQDAPRNEVPSSAEQSIKVLNLYGSILEKRDAVLVASAQN